MTASTESNGARGGSSALGVAKSGMGGGRQAFAYNFLNENMCQQYGGRQATAMAMATATMSESLHGKLLFILFC